MSPRAQPTTPGARGRKTLLPALAALVLALAGLAHGAPSGPNRDAGKEDAAPVFGQFGGVRAPELAASGLGMSCTPAVGPLDFLFVLHAGEKPELNSVWRLEGPMTLPGSKARLGCGTLVLMGFSTAPVAVPAELALLRAGHELECWRLRNTDVVRPISRLSFVKDGWMAESGSLEDEAYNEFLVEAHYTSEKAFERAARRDVTYAHLFNEPRRYRGEVVWIEGRLKRVRRFDPPATARAQGVNDLYEAWLMNDAYGYSNPFVVVFTELPPGVGPAEKINNLPVGFAGYFFKKYRYTAADSKPGQARESPLLIGHSIALLRPPDAAAADTEWARYLVPVFLGVVGLTAVTVIGLTIWLRRTDQRARQRLLSLRQGVFVEPSPGEEGNASVPLGPSGAPLARPVTAEESGPGPGGSSG